jgi:hypothetical protein
MWYIYGLYTMWNCKIALMETLNGYKETTELEMGLISLSVHQISYFLRPVLS